MFTSGKFHAQNQYEMSDLKFWVECSQFKLTLGKPVLKACVTGKSDDTKSLNVNMTSTDTIPVVPD